MSLLGPLIPCTAADAARRAARFAAPSGGAAAPPGARKARIPHPDKPAQISGDPKQKLLEVLTGKLASGEEVSAYQLSLLESYGMSLADLGSRPASAKKRKGSSSSAPQLYADFGVSCAEEWPASSKKKKQKTYAAVAAAGTGAAAAAAPTPLQPPPPPASDPLPAASASSPSVTSLTRLAKSLERLKAAAAAGARPLTQQEKRDLASLPSVYDQLMARLHDK
jgi:hypothetical protein